MKITTQLTQTECRILAMALIRIAEIENKSVIFKCIKNIEIEEFVKSLAQRDFGRRKTLQVGIPRFIVFMLLISEDHTPMELSVIRRVLEAAQLKCLSFIRQRMAQEEASNTQMLD